MFPLLLLRIAASFLLLPFPAPLFLSISHVLSSLLTHICSGEFSGSCDDISLSGATLYANCKNYAEDYVSASINTGKSLSLIALYSC
jgi:hypothetical protein